MDTLAEIVRRWIGAVAQNGALSGAAVNACRKAIDEDAALTAKKIASLEAENAALRKESNAATGALEMMLERVEEPPESNCSCHMSAPCSDCFNYSGLREAFEVARSALKASNG